MKKRLFPILATLGLNFGLVLGTSLAQEPSPKPAESASADAPVARAEPVHDREIATRLQIFLDQQHFGPGIIDGKAGEFTLKALGRYQRAHGLPVTGKLEDASALPLQSVYPIYTTYTIGEADLKQVGDVPSKPEQQSKKTRLPYASLLEFLEERFHASPDFLAKLNPGLDLEKLAVGDTVRVPNVEPFKIEEVREVGKLPPNPAFKSRRIHVDTKERMLDLLEGDTLIASFPITPGSAKLPAPAGTWRIVGIATLPWFRHDEGVLNYGVRTDHFYNIPSGPNNPVGVVWCGLSKPGIGIHGTNVPETIGRAGSHGCIRVANWDVIRLAGMIAEGVTVVIDDGAPRPKGPTESVAGPGNKPAEKGQKAEEAKLSSKTPLTESGAADKKTTPQNPGRDTNYANH
jgi:lipoprotein-anchoring transpeptidase ErfK/SrfK